MYRPPGVADREFWLYFARFLAPKVVRMGLDSPQDSFGPVSSQTVDSRLDPLRTKFNVFGLNRIFGGNLTSPVAADQLAAGAFFSMKMTT